MLYHHIVQAHSPETAPLVKNLLQVGGGEQLVAISRHQSVSESI